MFKWLGRNQSQKALNEAISWLQSEPGNIKKIRKPLGFILMKLFRQLPEVSRDNEKDKFDTNLYFLKVMLPKNEARILGGNIYKKAMRIESNNGRPEEYITHIILSGYIHMISQIQGKRSSTASHVFEINEGTADYEVYRKFESLIRRIFENNETQALLPDWEYIDNINTNSPMLEWNVN